MVTVQRICAWHPLYWPREIPPLLGTYEQPDGTPPGVPSYGCCDRCFVRALEELADSRVRRGCLGKRSYPCRHAARVALERSGIPRHGGPIGCMLEDHESGRGHVAAVGAAISALRRQFRPSQGVRVYRCWYSHQRHYHLGHEIPAPIADAV